MSEAKNNRKIIFLKDTNGFVGLNAEGWKVMSEIEVLNPYLCENCSYSNTRTETLKKHQETNHRDEGHTCKYCVDAVNKKNDLTEHS